MLLSAKIIKILGYIISKGNIKPDPERLNPLLRLPVPNDLCTLRRALGIFTYYAYWIPSFSDKIHILTTVMKFALFSEVVKTFQELKKRHCNGSHNNARSFSTAGRPSRLELQKTPTASLQRCNTSQSSFLDITLNYLMAEPYNARALENAEYPFIPITPRSTLAQRSSA